MAKCKLCVGHMITLVLVVVGALNWGLVGAFEFNLVNKILGSVPTLERVIYVVVGLAGLMMLMVCKCKKCNSCCGGKDSDCCKKE